MDNKATIDTIMLAVFFTIIVSSIYFGVKYLTVKDIIYCVFSSSQ